MLEKGDGGVLGLIDLGLQSKAVGFQRVNRGRGGFGKRHIVLLQSGSRFADPLTKTPGHPGDGFQNLFLSGHLRLLPINNISGPGSSSTAS